MVFLHETLQKMTKNRSIFMIWYWNWLLFVVFTFFTISKSIFFLWSEASLKMAVNFIKEIEVITVSLETQAGIAGNFVWSQGREKSQIKNILLQISIDKVGLRGLKKEKNKRIMKRKSLKLIMALAYLPTTRTRKWYRTTQVLFRPVSLTNINFDNNWNQMVIFIRKVMNDVFDTTSRDWQQYYRNIQSL